ncbi:hypothetical protein ACSSV4_000612 [Roseovarius sp. MBR-154]|jgi:hypothetical protein
MTSPRETPATPGGTDARLAALARVIARLEAATGRRQAKP